MLNQTEIDRVFHSLGDPRRRRLAPWIPVTVVPTSFATVAIETFITELSSVIRNCPAASVSSTSIAGAAAARLRAHRKDPARSGNGRPHAPRDGVSPPLGAHQPAMELDAAEDAERDRSDRSHHGEDVGPGRGVREGQEVVSPIRPSEPGTSSQKPGRNMAYTGIVDWSRAS